MLFTISIHFDLQILISLALAFIILDLFLNHFHLYSIHGINLNFELLKN
jgi:hypothetical protein